MAKWLDTDGVLYLWNKVKLLVNDAKTVVNNTLTSTSTTQALSAAQGKVLKDTIDAINNNMENMGAGDMLKSKYDIDNDGIVDNAEKVNGHTVDSDVPADAKFTDTTYSPATASANGLMSASDFTKLNALPTNENLESTYAKKSDISGMYVYKGSVTNSSSLPTSGVEKGWVYNIVNASEYGGAGMNVVWTGSDWDALGEVFTIERITNTELDAICV